jgi:hypothetical protein
MTTSTVHLKKKFLTLLLLGILTCQAFGRITSTEASGKRYQSTNLGAGPELAESASDPIQARLQQLFAVDSALAHNYM